VKVLLLLLTCAVFALSSPSLAASTSDYDGKYSGTISCDALPGQDPLRGKRFSLDISDGHARYEREVLKWNTTQHIGVTEKGAGPVSPDGDVSLKGSAGSSQWSYTATYQGRFNGKDLHLTGAQQWQLPGSHAAFTRPCTIRLAPSTP